MILFLYRFVCSGKYNPINIGKLCCRRGGGLTGALCGSELEFESEYVFVGKISIGGGGWAAQTMSLWVRMVLSSSRVG